WPLPPWPTSTSGRGPRCCAGSQATAGTRRPSDSIVKRRSVAPGRDALDWEAIMRALLPRCAGSSAPAAMRTAHVGISGQTWRKAGRVSILGAPPTPGHTGPSQETSPMQAKKIVTALALVAASTLAAAADWPSQPIRLIVPYPPGGGNDGISRMVDKQ